MTPPAVSSAARQCSRNTLNISRLTPGRAGREQRQTGAGKRQVQYDTRMGYYRQRRGKNTKSGRFLLRRSFRAPGGRRRVRRDGRGQGGQYRQSHRRGNLRGRPAGHAAGWRWRAGPAAVLSRAAETANTAVYHRAVTDPDCRGMGTTMVAALVVEQTAYLLNIGDSRAYHINEDGTPASTRDHSVVEDMVARGDITPEEARTHPRKNLITRALGSEERIRAESVREGAPAGGLPAALLRRAEQHRHGPGAALRGHPRRGAVGLLPAPAPHHSVQRRAGQRYGGPLSKSFKRGYVLWIST